MGTRRKVIFVNPPNTEDLYCDNQKTVTKGVQHTDWANFPHLGILSLASYVDRDDRFEGVYLDGVACPWETIEAYLRAEHEHVLAVCVSLITANYEAGVRLCEHAKAIDPEIATIVGNDHFSAMHSRILPFHHRTIDYGFVGNEIFSSLLKLLAHLQEKSSIPNEEIPGLTVYVDGQIRSTPQRSEGLFTEIDYNIIDRAFQHSDIYSSNFQRRLGPRLQELFQRSIKKGTPIEIGRGCIKFSNNDACSFCSIQFGGMWRNAVEDGTSAWEVVRRASEAGYDYLYVTADELPLTFAGLIRQMHGTMPDWWLTLPESERPIFTGYARADGLHKGETLRLLHEIGFRILYVGVDAGTPVSLAAMNKPLRGGPKGAHENADHLFEANKLALERTLRSGMRVKAGFVLGHLGMTEELLRRNVECFCDLVCHGRDVLVSVDVEVLSPEPGSLDFEYLTDPLRASRAAEALGLGLAPERRRWEIAEKYLKADGFRRTEAIKDYIAAVMPGLCLDRLSEARDRIRSFCRSVGVVVGDEL